MNREDRRREQMRKVDVCAHCLRASCVRGVFECALRREGKAQTIAYPLRTLIKLAKEGPAYWEPER